MPPATSQVTQERDSPQRAGRCPTAGGARTGRARIHVPLAVCGPSGTRGVPQLGGGRIPDRHRNPCPRTSFPLHSRPAAQGPQEPGHRPSLRFFTQTPHAPTGTSRLKSGSRSRPDRLCPAPWPRARGPDPRARAPPCRCIAPVPVAPPREPPAGVLPCDGPPCQPRAARSALRAPGQAHGPLCPLTGRAACLCERPGLHLGRCTPRAHRGGWSLRPGGPCAPGAVGSTLPAPARDVRGAPRPGQGRGAPRLCVRSRLSV